MFPRIKLTIFQHWFRYWCRSGDKPLSEPMVASLLMHICVTGPQWAKIHCPLEDNHLFAVSMAICWDESLRSMFLRPSWISTFWQESLITFAYNFKSGITFNSLVWKPLGLSIRDHKTISDRHCLRAQYTNDFSFTIPMGICFRNNLLQNSNSMAI